MSRHVNVPLVAGVVLITLGLLGWWPDYKPVRAQGTQVEQAAPEFIWEYTNAASKTHGKLRVWKLYHLKTQTCWIGWTGTGTLQLAPKEVCR